jgi:hypothetical protein
MRTRNSRLLPLEDKSSWVLSANADGNLIAHLMDSGGITARGVTLGSADGGWDATLDAEGTPWVVFVSSDTGCIAARRVVGGEWGPTLQVSAEDGQNPIIRADEFSNIWIFWKCDSPNGEFECRACRMGPRSGQEMVAVTFELEHDIRDAGCRGGVIWIALGDFDSDPWIVSGTEHDGFGAVRQVSATT